MIGLIRMNVEVPHSYFAEITWMVFIKVDTVMMLTTCITTTSGMLAVFANTAMTMRHVSS